ncbi:MAG: chemotaxis protein CheX [Terriglobales bacterium]
MASSINIREPEAPAYTAAHKPATTPQRWSRSQRPWDQRLKSIPSIKAHAPSPAGIEFRDRVWLPIFYHNYGYHNYGYYNYGYNSGPRNDDSMTTSKAAKVTDMRTGLGEATTPRGEWAEVLRSATLEVFATMVGTTLNSPSSEGSAESASPANDASVVAYVTGLIGIAGAMRAVFSLRCSDRVATQIASKMLMIPIEEAAAQKSDAIGEVCNIIAGHFKHKIGAGEICTLTIPTVVIGASYSIHCTERGERLEFPVAYEGETVLVTLDIRG